MNVPPSVNWQVEQESDLDFGKVKSRARNTPSLAIVSRKIAKLVACPFHRQFAPKVGEVAVDRSRSQDAAVAAVFHETVPALDAAIDS